MNAKEFLSRAYRLETRIANKNEQIYRLRALAERVTASYGREAVSRSRNTDSMADSIARISELEMKLRNTVDELVAIRKDIADVIDQVPDISCQTLLELRYLCMKPPRYRLVIPLTRDISPEEYNAITRFFAAEQGIEMFDTCSFTPSQLMFWPTTSSDGEYIFREVEGAPMDPDAFLARYPSWKDPLSLPTSSKEAPAHEGKGKVEDPLTKEGIVGTFCRAVGTIQNAIDLYLSDVYEKVRDDRYHLIGSSSGPGVQIYNDRLAYSNHATDLAARQTCNAFDLVRLRSLVPVLPREGDLPETGRGEPDACPVRFRQTGLPGRG